MTTLESMQLAIKQARERINGGDFQGALSRIDGLGTQAISNTEALYIKGVCLRKLKQHEAAIQTLQQLLALDASFARAHQEIGYVFLSANKARLAINAFEQAVAVDSALLGSWRALSSLYISSGNKVANDQALSEIQQLEHLHPALQAVKSNLNRDKIELADEICRAYMLENKKDIEGLRLLAEIAIRAKILDEAEFILESAVAFAPRHIGARFDYSNILLKRQKFGEAHELTQQLNNEHPNNNQFKAQLSATLMGVGEIEAAVKILHELIEDKFSLEHSYLLLGHAQKTFGNLQLAVEAYQKLYQYKPDFGDAFWSLANSKTYSFTEAEVLHMEDYKSRETTSSLDKVHFNFALGKAYEDLDEYTKAFTAYQEGNHLNKQLLDYRAPETQKRIARQKAVCSKALFDTHKDVGAPQNDPIFIVGLPRAGSTLLEQILASHSQVDGTLELPNILSLSRRLRGKEPSLANDEPQYPRILADLDPDYFRKFGEQYINDTQVFRQGANFFIDKMPNNFMHIGLIKLILPNAKVIDARRHPMACCFSGFKQLFAEGQEYTYGLEEIGDYYKNYVEVMDHWDEVLPNFVLRVQHEDVVNDLDTQVNRILEFCGLPFEKNCIEFYKTKRNVRTPSSEQVRQPIYTTGLEQWRNFEKHLQPLKDALGPEILTRYPIV